jgi:hypothetical protein
MARPHHTEFAQHVLPEEAFLNPAQVWPALRDPARALPLLREQWALAFAFSGALEPLDDEGLAAEPCEVAGQDAVLITFPAPMEAGEAFCAVLVLNRLGAPFRYFLLEAHAHAPDPASAGQWRTKVGEQRPETATHITRGAGPLAPAPEASAAFLTRVTELINRKSAEAEEGD